MTVAQRSSAARMIAAKGQTVTLTRRTPGAYSPANGAAAITETTQTGKGVILDFAARKMGESNIPMAGKQCLLSALNSAGASLTAPAIDDTLTDVGGNAYTVVSIAPLAPAGLEIMFDLTLRGAA